MVLFASVVVAVVLLVVLFSWVFQRRLIYLPSTGAVPSAATILAGGRDVQLTTSDGLMLGAWYVPARGPAGTFTVLVANGNAGDRSVRAPLARALANQGFGVHSTTGAMAETRGAQARTDWLGTCAPLIGSSPTRACPVNACCTSAKASALRWSLSWRPSTCRPGWCCGHRSPTSPRWDRFTTRSCRYVRC